MGRGGRWNDMSLGPWGRGRLRTSPPVCPASSSEWPCRVLAGRCKDHLYIEESKNNGSWALAHPVFWFCVFQHISVSWWQPWVWRLVRIACGATVPTKPSCLCGSFWLQLTPWLSRWGCGRLSRFLASRQLPLLCRDALSLETAKEKKIHSRKTFADNTLAQVMQSPTHHPYNSMH